MYQRFEQGDGAGDQTRETDSALCKFKVEVTWTAKGAKLAREAYHFVRDYLPTSIQNVCVENKTTATALCIVTRKRAIVMVKATDIEPLARAVEAHCFLLTGLIKVASSFEVTEV